MSSSLKDINLDIQKYSISELEIFFKLNDGYNGYEIEEKETQLKKRILKSKYSNDKEFIQKLLHFVANAKYLLKSNLSFSLTDDSNSTNTRELEVIHKPLVQYPHDYNNSFQREFVPGVMNPLRVNEIVKCLTIDTRFRDNFFKTESTDFILTLPEPMKRVVSMQITDLEIPVTFYNITDYYCNNFLHITIYHYDLSLNPLDNSGNIIPNLPVITSKKCYTLPNSNYNAVDLINKMNELFAPTDANGVLLYPNSIFSYIQFTIDITPNGSGTALVTLSPNPLFALFFQSIEMDFTIDVHGLNDNTPQHRKFGWLLGFTKSKYCGSPSYTGESVVDPATIRYIYLSINDFNYNRNDSFVTAFYDSVIDKNIICRIPINSTYFSIIFQNNLPIEPRQYFGPVDIQKLQIRLYDDYGRILQMNGANFSFCLKFKMIYE